MKQAQAVFRLCDFDNNGSVSRSELLAFAQDQHPLGKHLPRKEKSALFVHVGQLFEKLGVLSSKEEVEMPLWVDRAISDDVVWEHLNAINPYRHYFQDWDDSTTGMQNVLNALLLMVSCMLCWHVVGCQLHASRYNALWSAPQYLCAGG